MDPSEFLRRRKLLRYWEPPFLVSAIFVTFVVARYMQWGARRDILATIRFELLLGVALIASCAYLLQVTPIPLHRLPGAKRLVTGISLLFAAMIVQLPFAVDQAMATTVFWDRVVKFAMLTFFIAVLVRSPKTLRWFLFAFLFACFYVTLESARGAITGGLVWENQGIMRLHGAVPIYAHPNSLSGVAMGVIPFVVFLFPVLRSWKYKLAILMPLVTAITCILYSGSRTGYVAFFVFLFFWWTQSRRKFRWIGIAVGLSLAVYPVIPQQYVQRFKSIGGQEAEGHSKETRIVILDDAVKIFASNPFGVGVASFPAARRARFGRSQDTHNLYLEVATNLGIQGFVVFMFLIAWMLSSLRRVTNLVEREQRQLAAYIKSQMDNVKERRYLRKRILDLRLIHGAAQATAGFVWVRLALGMFGMDLYEVYWWFAAGLAISLELITDQIRRSHRRFFVTG